MRQGACTIDDLDEYGCAPIHNEDDKACGNWRKIELPLEQRYQQLEQVATNAIHLLEIIEDDLGAEVTFTRDETHEKWSAKVFRDQLEELGIEP